MYGAEAEWNEELLLQKIGDYEIFKFYIPNFIEIGKSFSSPFRKDNNPSCNIIEYNNRLWYKDFGDPNQFKAETCVQLIMRLYSLDYKTTIQKIRSDLLVKRFKPVIQEVKKIKKQSNTKIRIKRREWTEEDENYWRQYGITIDLLEQYNVSPISHFWIIKDETILIQAQTLCYSFDYYWNEGIFRRKIYQPLADKKEKWFSVNDTTVIQGWKMLPKTGDILIITKSLKDVITLRVAGYYAIASNSESSFIPESVFNKLKKRWNKIIIWYDNDETGLIRAKIYSDKYNIPFITTDDIEKDPSDYRKAYGEIKFLNLLKQKLICE